MAIKTDPIKHSHTAGVDKIGKPTPSRFDFDDGGDDGDDFEESGGSGRNRQSVIEADTDNSSCFDSLEWEDGTATAEFINGGGVYDYDMTRAEFLDWIEDDSLGGYFNDMIK